MPWMDSIHSFVLLAYTVSNVTFSLLFTLSPVFFLAIDHFIFSSHFQFQILLLFKFLYALMTYGGNELRRIYVLARAWKWAMILKKTKHYIHNTYTVERGDTEFTQTYLLVGKFRDRIGGQESLVGPDLYLGTLFYGVSSSHLYNSSPERG